MAHTSPDLGPSERVAIGAAIEAELRGRVGNPNLQSPIVENFPPLETPEGKTRDLVANCGRSLYTSRVREAVTGAQRNVTAGTFRARVRERQVLGTPEFLGVYEAAHIARACERGTLGHDPKRDHPAPSGGSTGRSRKAGSVPDPRAARVPDLDYTAPAPVKSAALLLVGDLYANREAQADR